MTVIRMLHTRLRLVGAAWVPLVLSMSLASDGVSADGKTSTAEDDRALAAAALSLVERLTDSAATGEYEAMLACMSAESAERVRDAVAWRFDQRPEKLMEIFKFAHHPGRLGSQFKIEDTQRRWGRLYVKVVKTAPYSLRDGSTSHPIAEKPVELWAELVPSGDAWRLSLWYPVHDILYLLQ